jgi:hypothetical protein
MRNTFKNYVLAMMLAVLSMSHVQGQIFNSGQEAVFLNGIKSLIVTADTITTDSLSTRIVHFADGTLMTTANDLFHDEGNGGNFAMGPVFSNARRTLLSPTAIENALRDPSSGVVWGPKGEPAVAALCNYGNFATIGSVKSPVGMFNKLNFGNDAFLRLINGLDGVGHLAYDGPMDLTGDFVADNIRAEGNITSTNGIISADDIIGFNIQGTDITANTVTTDMVKFPDGSIQTSAFANLNFEYAKVQEDPDAFSWLWRNSSNAVNTQLTEDGHLLTKGMLQSESLSFAINHPTPQSGRLQFSGGYLGEDAFYTKRYGWEWSEFGQDPIATLYKEGDMRIEGVLRSRGVKFGGNTIFKGDDYGWQWGYSQPSAEPVAELSAQGDMQIKGTFTSDSLKVAGVIIGGATTEAVSNTRLHVDGRVYISEESGTEKGLIDTENENYKDYLLWVEEGIVSADFAIAETIDWPDYVFEESYVLTSMEELENHILEEGHLPNFPSAEEVQTMGYTVDDMTKRLVKTVEELTLYNIEQEKQINKQNALIERLMSRLDAIEAGN